MRVLLRYLLPGFLFMLVATSVLPRILPFHFKPDLILILVFFLALHEELIRGSFVAYLLGCLQDVFAGHYLGLYGLVFLILFVLARLTVRRLNTDSGLLMIVLVFVGTLFQGLVLIFLLGVFAEAGPVWQGILYLLVPQALLNVVAAIVIHRGAEWLDRLWQRRRWSGSSGLG